MTILPSRDQAESFRSRHQEPLGIRGFMEIRGSAFAHGSMRRSAVDFLRPLGGGDVGEQGQSKDGVPVNRGIEVRLPPTGGGPRLFFELAKHDLR